jgi:hypothetical protein
VNRSLWCADAEEAGSMTPIDVEGLSEEQLRQELIKVSLPHPTGYAGPRDMASTKGTTVINTILNTVAYRRPSGLQRLLMEHKHLESKSLSPCSRQLYFPWCIL